MHILKVHNLRFIMEKLRNKTRDVISSHQDHSNTSTQNLYRWWYSTLKKVSKWILSTYNIWRHNLITKAFGYRLTIKILITSSVPYAEFLYKILHFKCVDRYLSTSQMRNYLLCCNLYHFFCFSSHLNLCLYIIHNAICLRE